ncbi:hypothetical protein [Streptomyces narbonensis]|uniref:hypothetical protein n=1 Tax=Streptomyces narbonensis TaxID=67333 RepID=UPI0033C16570
MIKTGGSDTAGSLAAGAAQVYACLLAREQATFQEIQAEVRCLPADAEKAVRALIGWGLLQGPSEDGHFHAVSPETARRVALSPLYQEVQGLQHAIAETSAAFDMLTPVYETHAGARGVPDLEEIHSLPAVRNLITGLAVDAQEEVLTSQPGGPRPEELIRESLAKAESLLQRNVRMRTLYQHSAQFDQGTIAYVEHVARRGAAVRTTAAGFPRVLIFDRRVAVLSLRGSKEGALIARSPSVVDMAVQAFEHAWAVATDFPVSYDREVTQSTSNAIRSSIEQQLVDGISDKRISEGLGLSLRAVQRHIAEIIRELGARNRLHAGYLLCEKRLHNGSAPPDGSPETPAAQP